MAGRSSDGVGGIWLTWRRRWRRLTSVSSPSTSDTDLPGKTGTGGKTAFPLFYRGRVSVSAKKLRGYRKWLIWSESRLNAKWGAFSDATTRLVARIARPCRPSLQNALIDVCWIPALGLAERAWSNTGRHVTMLEVTIEKSEDLVDHILDEDFHRVITDTAHVGPRDLAIRRYNYNQLAHNARQRRRGYGLLRIGRGKAKRWVKHQYSYQTMRAQY